MEARLLDTLLAEDQAETGFAINDDQTADWAVRKVLGARSERDRQVAHHRHQIEMAEKACADVEARILGLLRPYFEQVPYKQTKTKASYALASGTLVRKEASCEYKRDEEALSDWLERSGYEDLVLVRTVRKPQWGEFKAQTVVDGGQVVDKETGEVVDGVTVIERPATMTIE